jgi:uncharacterized membrane protein YphA (DoxX/SURF4 family)
MRPWLPWPLCRSAWWTEPVRAERLAVLRLGVAGILFLDLLTSYLPHVFDRYGADSLGAPEIFAWMTRAPRWSWSVFRGVEDPYIVLAGILVLTLAALLLLLGLFTRVSAVLAFVLSTSLTNVNPYVENAGEDVRGILLFYLMLCPCGAVWSLDRKLGRWKGLGEGPTWVYPWPLRLLFVQLMFIYFANGAYKLPGKDWHQGNSLYYVLGDLSLCRWSYALLPLPVGLTRLLTWSVLAWEISFPLWMMLPGLVQSAGRLARPLADLLAPVVTVARGFCVAALLFGVLFHLGIWVSMEIGMFAPMMLCFYLPLLPWERWTDRRPAPHEPDWPATPAEPATPAITR